MNKRGDRAPASEAVTRGVRSTNTREARAFVEGFLVDMWHAALEAGLSPEEAAVVCRVMVLRIPDAMEVRLIPSQTRSLVATHWAQDFKEEVERSRRATAWESTVEAALLDAAQAS